MSGNGKVVRSCLGWIAAWLVFVVLVTVVTWRLLDMVPKK